LPLGNCRANLGDCRANGSHLTAPFAHAKVGPCAFALRTFACALFILHNLLLVLSLASLN